MLFIVVVSLLVAGSSAEILIPGPCPNITGVAINFNALAGRWYEYARTIDKNNNTLRCISYELYTPEDKLTRMFSTGISKSSGNVLAVESEVTLDQQTNEVNLVSYVPLVGKVTAQYRDLEVVPGNYEISWSCHNRGSYNVQSMGLYTRNPNPSGDVIKRAQQLALEKGLQVPNFVIFDNDCHLDSCVCQ